MGISSIPNVWALLGARRGDNQQVLALARALGWPYETIEIQYNLLFACPNRLLGATHLTISHASPPLTEPWPDLVLAIGQRSVPVARWIRERSGRRTKLVQLGRPRAPLDWFDLIITTPQYELPTRPNILHNPLPLHHINQQRLQAALQHWKSRLASLPEPLVALFIGGPSGSYRLDQVTARRITATAAAEVRRCGGSLLVSTAPRTPQAVASALINALDVPCHIYRWDQQHADEENPYLGYLALADRFIVTGESVSMLAEACSTGKPVRVLPLPKRVGNRWLGRKSHGWLQPLMDHLAEHGILTPPRNVDAVHANLVQCGAAHWENGELLITNAPNERQLAWAVNRIYHLLQWQPPTQPV